MKSYLSKILKKTIMFCCFFFIWIGAGWSQGFTISGTQLIDANGNPVILKGMAIPLAWFITDVNNNIVNMKNVTNANCMRIVMATNTADASWQKCVQTCIDNKIIPMVELHDVTCSTDASALNRMAQWWVSKASYLTSPAISKYILINLANEWGDWAMSNSNQVAWSNAYKTAITTMRNGGINTTLVIDSCGCGQDIRNGETLRTYAKGLETYDPKQNLLFSVHFYGEWASGGGSSITTGIPLIKNSGFPFIVGEFSQSVNYSAVVSTCNSNGIGFMAWSWIGNNEPALDMALNWQGTSLTAWGNTVINGANGIKTAVTASVFNSGPIVTPTPTTPPSVIKGDVNGDAKIDIVDALLIAQYYIGLNPSGFNAQAADVNCSGTVDIVDALLVAQRYVGIISNFPC